MIEELREIGEDCDNEKEAVDIKRAVAEREVALENTRAIVREAALDAAAKGEGERDGGPRGSTHGKERHERDGRDKGERCGVCIERSHRRAQTRSTDDGGGIRKGEKTLAALTESGNDGANRNGIQQSKHKAEGWAQIVDDNRMANFHGQNHLMVWV